MQTPNPYRNPIGKAYAATGIKELAEVSFPQDDKQTEKTTLKVT